MALGLVLFVFGVSGLELLLLDFLFLLTHNIGITMQRAAHFGSVVGHVVALGFNLVVVFVVSLYAFLQVVDVNSVVFFALFF